MLHISDLYIGFFSNLFRKKLQHNFPKMRGGGVKGRLEIFQNFISFGSLTRPLVGYPLCPFRDPIFSKMSDGFWEYYCFRCYVIFSYFCTKNMFQHVSCCDGNWCEMYAVSWGVILSIECSEPPSLTADQEAWNQFSFFSKPHASYPYCYQRGNIIIIISQTVLNARAQSATPRLLKFSGQLFSRAEHSIALVGARHLSCTLNSLQRAIT